MAEIEGARSGQRFFADHETCLQHGPGGIVCLVPASAAAGLHQGDRECLAGIARTTSPRGSSSIIIRMSAIRTLAAEAAGILGNSPAVVGKHYRKWSKGRQANIDRLMFAHFQTAPVTVAVTRKLWSCKLMKIQGLKWCGEGDLFSRWSLKTRKLYTSQRRQSSQRARNTKSSHTASHTGAFSTGAVRDEIAP